MSNLFGGTPLPGRFDKVEKADLTGVTQVASTINVRDKEMRRRFERAENMRRDDINEAAGYDLASIGQFGSEIFQQEVDEATQLIASGQLNPTEARAKLGELKSLFNQFNTHSEAMSTEDAVANKLATDPQARKARNSQLGVGEQLSYGVDDYAAQHNAALNNVFKSGSAQKGPDGQWTVVDPNTGERVPFSQVTGFANANHFYRYGSSSVDVGTLGDWAQDKSTASAISFKDGKWNEARSRDFYRDNVLTEDDNGKTHRLQLLGTLEDRGLIDHLTDEQKRNFRDGVDLGSESFQDIIRKGEDEFVSRSQFEGTYGTSSKRGGGGSGGDSEPKRDFVVGGLNVESKSTGELLSNLGGLGTASHNLNRFNKPPVLEGAFEVPGKPNTENIQIVGAGVNEKGEQVAYIRGKQRVEVEGAIPGIEGDSDLVPYFKEIPIGGSASGVSSDVMREIQQNHPEMYRQILQDQDKYEEDKLRAKPIAATSSAVDREGATTMDAQGNVVREGGRSATTPDTGDAADRGEASLGARDAAVDEYRGLLDNMDALKKQMARSTGSDQAYMNLVKRMESLQGRMDNISGGEFGEYITNVFAQESQGGVSDELRPFENTVETRQEREDRVRSETRQNVADTFFNNPIGRAFGYQGPEARAEAAAEEARRSARTTSTPVQVPEDQVADLRDSLSPTMQDRLDRALDEAVRRGADGVGARRNENGDIVVTDRRGVPVPGLTPIAGVDAPEARPAGEVPNPALERSPVARTAPSEPGESRVSELAMNLVGAGAGSQDGGIGSYEGYSPDLQINVPAGSMNSGVTIAGLDIGSGAEGADEKLDILKDYLKPEDFKELEKLKGLKGQKAQDALKKLQSEGKLLEDGLGLSQKDLNEITARQAEKELPGIYKIIPEDRFKKLPTEVQRVVAGVHFNVQGPKTLAAVNKATKTNDPNDWREVANKYMTYWSGLAEGMKPEFRKWAEENNRTDLIDQINTSGKSRDFGDAVIQYKLDVGRILPGNLKRVEDAAAVITRTYNLDPLPSYAERTSGRAGSDDVAVN
tara:strand:- start:5838 stop:8969 length:3132 start_codon:yes stop_codon:yes gene_type:complete